MNYNFYGEDIIFPTIKYDENIDSLFKLISSGQFESKGYWKLLLRQYKRKTDTKDYGWRGEFWGKLMRSGCLVYAYTKNENLYSHLKATVIDIMKLQDSLGSISTYKLERQFSGWDMWSRKYVMLGLEYFYDICKEDNLKEKILASLILQADYIMDNVGENKKHFNQTSGIWCGLNSSSILQPYVKLYKLTKNKKYLDYSKYIVESNDVEGFNIFNLANRKDILVCEYPVVKIYEMTSCFEGLLELYEVTDNKDYLKMCENFAEKILTHEYTVVGGTGTRSEYFDNCTHRQTIFDPTIEMQETCVTVTMLKYFTKLFMHTKNVKYVDAFEKTFFNVYLGSINENYKKNKRPIFFSYSPMILSPRWKAVGGKKKISLNKFSGCCICFGGTGLGVLPKMSAMLLDNTIYLNMLIDGKYQFITDSGKINLTVTGDYPNNGNINIALENCCKNDIIVKVRKPNWCKKYNIAFNRNISYKEENGYIIFTTNNNITANFNMDMPLVFLSSSEFNSLIDYRVSISKGPITLALDDCKDDRIIPFDTSIDRDKQFVENGKVKYELSLKNGEKIVLSKYSDSAKTIPTETATSVWYRIK